jgi:hypothetical protein
MRNRMPDRTRAARTSVRPGRTAERTLREETDMAHPIDNNFSRVLEFVILAITAGCSIWLTLFAGFAGQV